MRRIDFSNQSLAFLAELPAKPARQIADKLDRLARDAEGQPSEQLKGYAPMRRLRAGEYRIVFRLEADVVKILLVGKRNDDEIYRTLARIRDK